MSAPVIVAKCSVCGTVVGRFYEEVEGVRIEGDHCPHGGQLSGAPASEIWNAVVENDPTELAEVADEYDVELELSDYWGRL